MKNLGTLGYRPFSNIKVMTSLLPIPGIHHGNRVLPSALDERVAREPDSPWVSVPIDDNDLSKGYKDITLATFANASEHASHWLQQNLPASAERFQPFLYCGPKDLRYPILAVAAAKVRKVVSFCPITL